MFFGRTDVEAENAVLWPPHGGQRVESLEKTLMLGGIGDGIEEEKGMAEDEMAGWHHRLDGHEVE